MKKLVTLVLCLMMLMMLFTFGALAENMGVQVIGGPAIETEPVSLDDMKLNVDAEIEGWGILTLTSCEVRDKMGCYKAGNRREQTTFNSGNEAEYVMIYADILNTTLSSKNYSESVSVKAVFDDVYEYGGWSYQRNYNNETYNFATNVGGDANKQNILWPINKADNFAIDPMYEGHYIYGCTLPNAVINSKKPLKLIITIDGNEITYNIRK